MKTFKSLALAGLLLAAVAGASAGEAGIEVIVVTGKQAQPAGIEVIVVTAKYPEHLTIEKVRPVMPIQIPRLNLEIAAMPGV